MARGTPAHRLPLAIRVDIANLTVLDAAGALWHERGALWHELAIRVVIAKLIVLDAPGALWHERGALRHELAIRVLIAKDPRRDPRWNR